MKQAGTCPPFTAGVRQPTVTITGLQKITFPRFLFIQWVKEKHITVWMISFQHLTFPGKCIAIPGHWFYPAIDG
jgi:hypothetical protein